jgi:hypothetical protein
MLLEINTPVEENRGGKTGESTQEHGRVGKNSYLLILLPMMDQWWTGGAALGGAHDLGRE